MPPQLRINAGELTTAEILAALNDGKRVLVSVEMLGGRQEISLRYDGDTYYCDTPTQLHKHSDEAEMRACIEDMGYGASESG